MTTPGGKPASAISSTSSVAQCGVSRRRLEHDRVAGDERRHHLPARDRHREVPGRDDPGHADRLADAHRPLVGQLGRDGVAEHPAALAGHQVGDVDAFLDVAARLGEDLAHLAGHRPREPLLVLGHERAEAYRISPRFGAGVRRHIGQAVSAALIAIATSACVPCWKRPTTSRVSAGLRLSNVCARRWTRTHSPAMKWRNVGGLDGGLGHDGGRRSCAGASAQSARRDGSARRGSRRPVGAGASLRSRRVAGKSMRRAAAEPRRGRVRSRVVRSRVAAASDRRAPTWRVRAA